MFTHSTNLLVRYKVSDGQKVKGIQSASRVGVTLYSFCLFFSNTWQQQSILSSFIQQVFKCLLLTFTVYKTLT